MSHEGIRLISREESERAAAAERPLPAAAVQPAKVRISLTEGTGVEIVWKDGKYTPPARPLEATPVGRYALKFKWADGHESGIYSWEFLRRLDESTPHKGA